MGPNSGSAHLKFLEDYGRDVRSVDGAPRMTPRAPMSTWAPNADGPSEVLITDGAQGQGAIQISWRCIDLEWQVQVLPLVPERHAADR